MFSLRGAVLSFELISGDAMALAYGQVNDQKVVSGDQSSSRVPVKCRSTGLLFVQCSPKRGMANVAKTLPTEMIKPEPPSQLTPQ
jgi:hypothetical protein